MSKILPPMVMRGAAVVVVTMSGLALFHCGKTADTEADAGKADDGGPSTVGTTPNKDAGGSTDASTDTGSSVSVDASPPDVSCSEDASVCEGLPPSTCADNNTILYFSDGTCTDGKCTWKTNLKPCGIQSNCVQGGCTPPTTK